MYKINFFVPESDLEKVKEAMFDAGAGKIGLYEKCCWQIKGFGQFLPMKNSNPVIGKIGKIEKLEEFKVEMVCNDKNIQKVVMALIKSHPYEEPAYDIVKMVNSSDW